MWHMYVSKLARVESAELIQLEVSWRSHRWRRPAEQVRRIPSFGYTAHLVGVASCAEASRALAASWTWRRGHFDAVRILHSSSHTGMHTVPVGLSSLTFDRPRYMLSKCAKV